MNPTAPSFEVNDTFSLLKELTEMDFCSKVNCCPLIGYDENTMTVDVEFGLDSALFNFYQKKDIKKVQTLFDLTTGEPHLQVYGSERSEIISKIDVKLSYKKSFLHDFKECHWFLQFLTGVPRVSQAEVTDYTSELTQSAVTRASREDKFISSDLLDLLSLW